MFHVEQVPREVHFYHLPELGLHQHCETTGHAAAQIDRPYQYDAHASGHLLVAVKLVLRISIYPVVLTHE